MSTFGPQEARKRQYSKMLSPEKRPELSSGHSTTTNEPRIQPSLATPTQQAPPTSATSFVGADLYNTQSKIKEMQQQQEYLKKYISRQSAMLALLVSDKQPSDEEIQQYTSSNITPPWIYSSQYMTPLLVAYDARNKDLESKSKAFEDQVKMYRAELEILQKERDELSQELQEELQNKLSQPSQGIMMGSTLSASEKEQLRYLQDRNSILEETNKAVDAEREALQQEVERLQNTSTSMHHQVREKDMDTQKFRSILQNAREKIRNITTNRDHWKKQAALAQKTIKQYQEKLADVAAAPPTYSTQRQQRQKEFEYSELEDRIASLTAENDRMVRERRQAFQKVGEAEETIAKHQQSEFNALHQVKELSQILEEKTEELKRLTLESAQQEQNIHDLQERLKQKSREHDDELRAQKDDLLHAQESACRKLQEQIKKLQMDNTNIDEKYARALREKKQAEDELRRVIKAAESEHLTPPKIIADLTRKISIAATERDEIERRYDDLRLTFSRQRLNWEKERETLSLQKSQLTDENERLTREKHDIEDRLTSLEAELQTLTKQVHQEKLSHEEEKRKLRTELETVNHDTQRTTHDLRRKLSHVEEQLLSSQTEYTEIKQRNEKLVTERDEYLRNHTDALEKKIGDLRAENKQLRNRTDDLENRVALTLKEKNTLMITNESLQDIEARLTKQYSAEKKRLQECNIQIRTMLQKQEELMRQGTDLAMKADRAELNLEAAKRETQRFKKRYEDLKEDLENNNAMQHLMGSSSGASNTTLNDTNALLASYSNSPGAKRTKKRRKKPKDITNQMLI